MYPSYDTPLDQGSDKKPLVPFTVKLAAVLVMLYGLTYLALGIAYAQSNGWGSIHVSIIRLVVSVGVGISLLQRQVWAWGVAVAGCAWFALMGALSALLLRWGQQNRFIVGGQDDVIVMWFTVLFLVTALVLLLLPVSRAAFDAEAEHKKAMEKMKSTDPVPPVPDPWSKR